MTFNQLPSKEVDLYNQLPYYLIHRKHLNMNTFIIGIHGKKHSGKTLLAQYIKDYLETKYPGEVRILNFADALKAEVCLACNVDLEFLEQHKEQFRMILQWWGTEFRRHFEGQDYWIDRLDHYIKQASPRICIIADVRFANELAYCKTNGVTVKITRTSDVLNDDKHTSEIALDQNVGWDELVFNNSSKHDLRLYAHNTVDHILSCSTSLKP